ncbi:MAG: hypothetical protein JNN05_01945, partial [Candidatus Omnitrophica bacterium]|nr:hypothetical protein [Candidatus Omnitrophota bacterium]
MINPILTQNSVSAPLLELIFDSLFRLDSKGDIIPGLAKNWSVSKDGLVIDFYLRQGVHFHDGVELTAEDVKFTYEEIMNPLNQSPWRSGCELFDRWEILDRYTIRLHLKKPADSIYPKLTREIAPRHLLAKENIRNSKFNYAPVGSGPFRIYSWDKNSQIIRLKANDDYFEGRPYLNEIVVKTFSSNQQLWAALLREEVDLVEFISEENYEILKKDPAFKTYAVPWNMHLAMLYNLNDPLFSDRDMRIALAQAVNVKDILKNISEISGSISVGPFISTSEMFNPSVKAIEFDPLRAMELFRKKGWVKDKQSGIFKKEGQNLEIRLLIDQRNKIFSRLVKLLRQQLAEVGVKLTAILYQDENDLMERKAEYSRPQAWLRYMFGVDKDGYEIKREWYYDSK